MNKSLDWVHHDSKTFDEEQFMENIERKYIEKHTSHIEGFTKDYVNKLLEEKDKEIEELNNIIDKQDRDITTLTKDKIKLKNIINELEKWLENELDERYSWHYREWINLVQETLKELKEGK